MNPELKIGNVDSIQLHKERLTPNNGSSFDLVTVIVNRGEKEPMELRLLAGTSNKIGLITKNFEEPLIPVER